MYIVKNVDCRCFYGLARTYSPDPTVVTRVFVHRCYFSRFFFNQTNSILHDVSTYIDISYIIRCNCYNIF